MEFAEFIKTPKVNKVSLQESPTNKKFECSLCITGHHLILSSRKEEEHEFWILHRSIDLVERSVGESRVENYLQATKDWINNPNINQITGSGGGNANTSFTGGTITLYCKNLRILKIDIVGYQDFLNVAESIEKLSKLDLEWHYPFFYRPMYNILENGYQIFTPEVEYGKLLATGQWRLTRVNEKYKVCGTYPKVIVVPNDIKDEEIIDSATFREQGRFPVYAYKHNNEAVLLRAGPITIQNGIKRCQSDENIVNIVLGRTTKGYILDTTKPGKVNVPPENYTQWKKVSHPIKITTDSFNKLIENCNDITCSVDKYLERLESCGWLGVVLKTLDAACIAAQLLDKEKTPVLIEGMDAALVISSLVQIILNPDCRTVRGFIALIDREFIQGGFPFYTRHKYGCYSPHRNKQTVPSFLLFLDCVYQLHYQFSSSFEFKTQLLINICENSYFSQYGTFLGDCEREREYYGINSKTISYWTHLFRPEVMKTILSPLYDPNPHVIWPSVAPCSLVLWSEFYLRWSIDQKYVEQIERNIQLKITQEKELRTKVIKLRKELMDLQKELNKLQTNSNST